jgi:hypothetical protein
MAWAGFEAEQRAFQRDIDAARRERQRRHEPAALRKAMFGIGRTHLPGF